MVDEVQCSGKELLKPETSRLLHPQSTSQIVLFYRRPWLSLEASG